MNYDLLILAKRIICPATGLDTPGAVAIRGDRISMASQRIGGGSRTVRAYPNAIVLPGLVDLHAHPARGGSKYGVDPDEHFLPRGTTTVLSQGDAGAGNWPAYHADVIRNSRTRVRLALNLSASGESKPEGCFADPRDVDVDACVRTIQAEGDSIWGIAVNISPIVCGDTSPRWVLEQALRASDLSGRPLLFGPRRGIDDFPLDEQLTLLRRGDVVTYCFHPDSQGLVHEGRVRDCVWKARERGVLFDIGHGMGSFDFTVAETAIREGFLPDTISTDGYLRHVGANPVHDLPRTMSKLIAAGMLEADAFARVTTRPAEIIGLAGEIGTLAPGSCADLSVIQWNANAAPLVDTTGATRPGGCWEPVITVRKGEVVEAAQA